MITYSSIGGVRKTQLLKAQSLGRGRASVRFNDREKAVYHHRFNIRSSQFRLDRSPNHLTPTAQNSDLLRLCLWVSQKCLLGESAIVHECHHLTRVQFDALQREFALDGVRERAVHVVA